MKRTLPTITPILYTSKTLANGEHPIMLRVCYNGKRSYKVLVYIVNQQNGIRTEKGLKEVVRVNTTWLLLVN